MVPKIWVCVVVDMTLVAFPVFVTRSTLSVLSLSKNVATVGNGK